MEKTEVRIERKRNRKGEVTPNDRPEQKGESRASCSNASSSEIEMPSWRPRFRVTDRRAWRRLTT
jgi:hypothetical protein